MILVSFSRLLQWSCWLVVQGSSDLCFLDLCTNFRSYLKWSDYFWPSATALALKQPHLEQKHLSHYCRSHQCRHPSTSLLLLLCPSQGCNQDWFLYSGLALSVSFATVCSVRSARQRWSISLTWLSRWRWFRLLIVYEQAQSLSRVCRPYKLCRNINTWGVTLESTL